MPLITVRNLTKYYGTDLILDHISFAIDHRERLGLIGANGTGKTTLCRILMGQEPYEDDSDVHVARDARLGYLAQESDFGRWRTPWDVLMAVYPQMREMEGEIKGLEQRMAHDVPGEEMDELLERHAGLTAEYESVGGHEYERAAATVLTGLGVPEADFDRDLGSFSGGEQRRVSLAQLLLTKPDLLLLDEPTNHLDIKGTEWLERYLQDYPGAVVAISHDRRFLDAVVSRILELECRELVEYTGGYSDHLQQKEQRLLTYERRYERRQDELKRQLSFIRWALGTGQEKRVRHAKSRLKLLDKLDHLDPPASQRRKMSLRFKPRVRGGDEILQLEGVTKQYGDARLFSGIDLFVRRGDRLGIVGPNGCGKTTLLRIALGDEQPTEGEARLGRSVEVGYHRQDEFGLTPENRVYDEFRLVVHDASEGETRNLLARFLFVEDDVFKRVGDLSGGEQCRLSLAKLIMTRPTLLVLDEPTNHLDIDSRSSLEAALREYEGTVIVVSHDRYFLDRVVQRVLVLHEGEGILHAGNYSSFVAHRREREGEAERLARERAEAEKRERLRRERAERKAKKALKKEAKRPEPREDLPPVEELEARAHYLENQLAKVRAILGAPETYSSDPRAQALLVEHSRLNAELAIAYDMWERAEAQASGD